MPGSLKVTDNLCKPCLWYSDGSRSKTEVDGEWKMRRQRFLATLSSKEFGVKGEKRQSSGPGASGPSAFYPSRDAFPLHSPCGTQLADKTLILSFMAGGSHAYVSPQVSDT